MLDILIIGAGHSGLTLALSLADLPLDIRLIDYSNINNKLLDFDGRTIAIAHRSKEFLTEIRAWEELEPEAGAIKNIRITDNNSSMLLDFDCKDVSNEPMGYIVENRHLRHQLLKKCSKFKNMKISDNLTVIDIKKIDDYLELKLSNDEVVQARLVISAEGKNTKIKELVGIETIVHDYKQSALVLAVKHEKPHQNLAVENFMPSGPFAILPMKDFHQSSIVWTENREYAEFISKMPLEEFEAVLKENFGSYLGSVSAISKIGCFPLKLNVAKQMQSDFFALVGDAAHGIHPIAGQGYNLAIRDIIVLSELIKINSKLGLHIGSCELLKEFEKQRSGDNWKMISAMHGLNALFSNNIAFIRKLRRFGISATNKLLPVKKFFINEAMGNNIKKVS